MIKQYLSKKPNKNGSFYWSKKEHSTWNQLMTRQKQVIKGRACEEFTNGINCINLDISIVPQHKELDHLFQSLIQWSIISVPSLIPEYEFFDYLSKKIFPCTSFIRTPEDIDYLEEPDIFHEYFGHLPLLTWSHYSDFLQQFGKFFIDCDSKYHLLLSRIFWFTIEFGLIKKRDGMMIYGAGILSSHGETLRALENNDIEIVRFDALTCARTPYRYDIMQSKYFFITDFEEIFSLFENSLEDTLEEALCLGDIHSTPSPATRSP